MTAKEDEAQLFNRGEAVLCYEPDPSKARVLYNSKVIAVYERKDEDGMKYFDYKIHFHGWNSKYDRNMRADFLLKANEENHILQHELAEAANLLKISGGYSYKDPKTPTAPASKKKRFTKSAAHVDEDTTQIHNLSAEQNHIQHHSFEQKKDQSLSQKTYSGNRSRDNSGSRKGDSAMRGTRGARNSEAKNNKKDAEDFKRLHQEDRVMLRISERLREYMEYDFHMIQRGKQHALPARVPIVKILEEFVMQRAVELAIGIKQDTTRARNTKGRNARMEREYDRVMSNVYLLKEVVDGLRIHFEFLLDDHLLYREEKEHALGYLTEKNMRKCKKTLDSAYEALTFDSEHYEKKLQKCLKYIDKRDGKNNTANHSTIKRQCPYIAAYNLPTEMRLYLHEIFSWRLLLTASPAEKSMVFGAPHLARLLIKLPEYLNASQLGNEQLEDLLTHLDTFINYLENHKEWFDRENYVELEMPVVEANDQGDPLSNSN